MIPPPLGASAVGVDGMYYVYLLRSLTTQQLYLGWTSDLRRRLYEHAAGASRYTRSRGPYELIYFEAYRHRAEAVAREGSLKKRHNVMKQLKARLPPPLATAPPRPQEVGG